MNDTVTEQRNGDSQSTLNAKPPPILAGIAAGVIGVSWMMASRVLIDPSGTSTTRIGCPFHTVTGLDCPGCGSTRSLAALTRGNIVDAFDHNIFAPVVAVLAVVSWAIWMWHAVKRQPHRPVVGGTRTIVTIGVAIVAFSVFRNTEAGSWFASTLST